MKPKTDKIKTYSNSKLCQTCAECCKVFWIYTDQKDDAVRASWLDTDKVSVIKIKEGLWKIKFHIPCKQLYQKEGKYFCRQYNGFKPNYCRTYPLNFLMEDSGKEVLELEKDFCPALKELTTNR